jgi:DNA-binding HxlR family transcriptional regulator
MKILKIISKSECPKIILTLNERTLTFGEIAKLVGHTAIATERLKELRKNNIVQREVLQDERRTVKYSLTEKGIKVASALKILGNV